MTDEVAARRARQREIWSMGDYPALARRMQPAADELVAFAGVGPADRVLDVAAGTGNVTVAALARGADVTASDLTPAMIEAGRARTGDAVDWIEADAEELPFPDATFDVVVSCFGLVFAPDPDAAIAEAFRVVRPGGTVALSAWTPEGSSGRLGRLVLHHLSAGAGGYDATLWGDDDTARRRLASHAETIVVERRHLPYSFPSREAARKENERTIGALEAARSMLDPTAYQRLIDDIMALTDAVNEADDGSVRFHSEYLLARARRR